MLLTIVSCNKFVATFQEMKNIWRYSATKLCGNVSKLCGNIFQIVWQYFQGAFVNFCWQSTEHKTVHRVYVGFQKACSFEILTFCLSYADIAESTNQYIECRFLESKLTFCFECTESTKQYIECKFLESKLTFRLFWDFNLMFVSIFCIICRKRHRAYPSKTTLTFNKLCLIP